MSQLYTTLKRKVLEIEKELGLNSPLKPEEIDSHQIVTKAYIVLAHAEIEKYFELLAGQVIYDSIKRLEANEGITQPLLSLCSSNLFAIKTFDYFSDQKYENRYDYPQRLYENVHKYYKKLYSNNGIKSKDIISMYWVLGLNDEDFDDVMLTMLDDFGSKRGRIAHTGNNINFKLLNYVDEKNFISQLIESIGSVDERLEEFLNPNTKINEIEVKIYNESS